MLVLSDKSFIPEIFRRTNDYLGEKGYRAALPDLVVEDDGYMFVTVFKDGVGYSDVNAAEYFAGIDTYDIPARFRASHDYANKNGYAFGYPNFHQQIYDNQLVYGTNLISNNAAEYKEVLGSEFGDIDFEDVPRRIKTAGSYAIRNGYAWGCPNFHQALKENGVVYGTYVFKAEYIERIPVKFDVLFANKVDLQTILNSGQNYAISLGGFLDAVEEAGETISEGFQQVADYMKEKVSEPFQKLIKKAMDSTSNLLNAGNVHTYAKNTALSAAREQKESGKSEELCSEAVRDIMFGIAIAIQAPTPTVPNPYAIVLASSANSLSKWACHEIYKES